MSLPDDYFVIFHGKESTEVYQATKQEVNEFLSHGRGFSEFPINILDNVRDDEEDPRDKVLVIKGKIVKPKPRKVFREWEIE